MRVACPKCGQSIEVPTKAVGGHVHCAGCGIRMRVVDAPPNDRQSVESGEPSLWRNPAVYLSLVGLVAIAIVLLKFLLPQGTALPGPTPQVNGASGAAMPKAEKPPQVVNVEPGKPQDLIIGHWMWTGPFEGSVITITNEFTTRGVVKVVQGGIPFEAKYHFVDDKTIQYELGQITQYSKIENITKDKLVVIDGQGVKRVWTRPFGN